MQMTDKDEAIQLTILMAKELQRNGIPAHRMEESIFTLCKHLGIKGDVFTSPGGLILNLGEKFLTFRFNEVVDCKYTLYCTRPCFIGSSVYTYSTHSRQMWIPGTQKYTREEHIIAFSDFLQKIWKHCII